MRTDEELNMERMEIALETAGLNRGAVKEHKNKYTSEVAAQPCHANLRPPMRPSTTRIAGGFYHYRQPIQQVNKKMRQYEEAGKEFSATYDRLRAQLLAITRERNTLLAHCAEGGAGAGVVLATMMELSKYRELMRKLERWEGLDQGGPYEPTALSEDDRKDKRQFDDLG
jgi:hypothetical protein